MNELLSKPGDGSVIAEDGESQQSGLQQEKHSRWRRATSAEGRALGPSGGTEACSPRTHHAHPNIETDA